LSAKVDALFAQAQRLDPQEPMTQLQWSVALQVLDRHKDAILHYQRALDLYPEWPLALKGMAFSYLEEGRADLALPILTDMSVRYPDDPMVEQLLQRAEQGGP
jgi:tetratricopeptide (TPR) repeat protein